VILSESGRVQLMRRRQTLQQIVCNEVDVELNLN